MNRARFLIGRSHTKSQTEPTLALLDWRLWLLQQQATTAASAKASTTATTGAATATATTSTMAGTTTATSTAVATRRKSQKEGLFGRGPTSFFGGS